MKNYYQILGLEKNATLEEIKKAYRIYAPKFHPDKQDGDKFFEERFKEIQEAYEILSDNNKRAIFDSKWKNNFSTGSSSFYSQYNKKTDEEIKREKEQKEEREIERKKREIRIKERKSKVFYTSKELIVNGMYIHINGKSYLLDDYDIVTLRKDDNSNFVFFGIVLIVIGVLTLAFFIGFLLLFWGIFGLFYKEYFLVLVNEKEDVPLIKGRKQKMKRIMNQINKTKELK